jgi:hypothetical protein
MIVVSAISLVLRFRRAREQERLQLKWLVSAAAAVAAMYLIVEPLSAVLVSSGARAPPWLLALQDASLLTFCLIPTSIGVAVLRYRLYGIDVIIRRTLVYTTLVASLAVVYLAGIYLIERALQLVTGQSGAFAVTLSTLAVAVMFQPLRRRIQNGVDPRFYRAKYNAAHTLDAFTNRLRDQIDLAALHTEVLDVVNTTLQPRHASLWIRLTEPEGPGPASRARETHAPNEGK